jgi:RNA polymerase sigma-70 factor (ECF subfamily)
VAPHEPSGEPLTDAPQLSGSGRVIVDEEADRALIERFRKGDRAAFAELVIKYHRPIYNAAFWILRKVEDANDVTQDVFLKVAERLDDYDPQYKFFSWIYRIAVNEALNLLRRSGREEALDEELDLSDAGHADPERRVGEAQLAKRIRAALMRLPINDRMVLSLRHFSECSYQEIGHVLELDQKTVKSRLFEARARLRRMLKDLR